MSIIKGYEHVTLTLAKKYTCPMHAQIVQDKPGNYPICGMTLVLAGKEGNASDDSHHKHDHNPSMAWKDIIIPTMWG